jgi:hypothetical protein
MKCKRTFTSFIYYLFPKLVIGSRVRQAEHGSHIFNAKCITIKCKLNNNNSIGSQRLKRLMIYNSGEVSGKQAVYIALLIGL